MKTLPKRREFGEIGRRADKKLRRAIARREERNGRCTLILTPEVFPPGFFFESLCQEFPVEISQRPKSSRACCAATNTVSVGSSSQSVSPISA